MNESPATSAVDCCIQATTDIDLTMQRLTVFVNVQFRNAGPQPIAQPQIVIVVSPPRACEISGKVLSPKLVQTLAVYVKGGGQRGWAFTTDDWFRTGRESGEYHIGSIAPLSLSPADGWISMHDLQVACDLDKLTTPLTVHAFIAVQGTRFPARNSIGISLSG